MWKHTRFPLAVLAMLSLAACDDGVGTASDAPTQILFAGAPAGSETAVLSDGALLQVGPAHLGEGPGGGTGPVHELVTPDVVSSVVVVLTGIEARLDARRMGGHGAGGPHFTGAAWVTVDVGEGVELDLMSLPVDGMPVAVDELELGTYGHVRLLFQDVTITFAEDVVIEDEETGETWTFLTGETYPLQVGGGEVDWIFVPTADFTVTEEDGADVVVEFDVDASIRGIAVLDDGTLVMPPIVRAWGQPFGSFGHGRHGPDGPNG